MNTLKKLLFVGGAAAAAASLTMAAAQADPPSTPRHIDIVGTGSDTTQNVLTAEQNSYNSTLAASAPHLYSFNAVGSTTIKEKVGCGDRTRPNGSGAGIAELEANLRPAGDSKHYCVDYARSSGSRSSTDPSSILYIPFAFDAVSWSADTLTGSTNATAGLTTKQLNAIYSCDASLLKPQFSGPVHWNEVGGTSKAKVIPVIPQSSSGTRKFFLSKIGVTTLGSCVQGQDNTVEENEGTNAIFNDPSTAPNIVFPYSVAVYLAQSQNGHGTGQQGNQVLRKIAGKAPTVGQSPNKKINANFPYIREVFNVVRNNGTPTSPVVPAYLRKIFGDGTANTGWICKNPASHANILSYGFLGNPNCGIIE